MTSHQGDATSRAAVLDECSKAYRAARVERDRVRDAAWDAMLDEYSKAYHAARVERDRQRDAAWAAWAAIDDGTDPLVAWIVQNCDGKYRSEALEIMELLPAPLSVLDEYAANEGWCETWQEFRDAAASAGVIPRGR